MKIIPPITITDAIMTSSTVPDPVEVLMVKATGIITTDVAVNHVHASGTITCETTDPIINEQFIIGSQTFTVKAARGGVGQVTLKTTAKDFADNIVIAVNLDIPGEVTATSVVDGIVIITAVSEDAAVGNAIDFSESIPSITMNGSGHLFGGISVSGPVVGETFLVHDQTFTIVASGVALGNVVRKTTTADDQANEIEISVNRDLAEVVTATHLGGVVTITAIVEGAEGNSIVLTEAVSGMTVSGAGTFTNGLDFVIGKTEWSAATDYAVGAEVVITATHTLYESLRTPNLNKPPATNLTGLTPYWLELGKTNRWKMFDTTVTSKTSNPSSIVVVLTPGVTINSVAVLNVNATTVTFLMVDGVTTRYNEHVHPASTDATNIVKTDLPSIYPAATLTVTIENTGDNATCGWLIIGTSQTLGTTRPNPTISLIDYSIKAVDTFGNYTITERSYSRRIECDIHTAIASLSTLKRLLAQYRATPMVWIASDLYAIMILYGFCKDFLISLPNYTLAETNLTIEGLV